MIDALVERRPQSLVVTLLGAYVYPDDRPVWSGGLVRLLGELGFSAGAARVALARLTRRELLERTRDGRLVYYRMTPRTAALLHEGERRIFALGRAIRAPAVWTLVWHAIPDEHRVQRARLSRRLRFLGFGSPQDGLWLAPHDRRREVGNLLDELGVTSHATVLVARPAGSAAVEPLVARAWDAAGLAARYRAFVEAFARYEDDGLADREAFLVRTRLAHAFRQFPSLDPELPDEVAPTNGHRERAVAIFHALYGSLAPPAQRHFDAATGSPAPRPTRASAPPPRSS
ncbi:MAG TPA: PaaX family transcriptional regulator C-terminal domain-containing protein [Gaiellaceae bacterium]|nr:PaaX family transcriptional regulator C-terminal domain-containing protein [Gaiellaceae bacterium]